MSLSGFIVVIYNSEEIEVIIVSGNLISILKVIVYEFKDVRRMCLVMRER